MKNRWISIVVFGISLFFCSGCLKKESAAEVQNVLTPAQLHGKLYVAEGTLMDQHGNPAVLRGMSTHGLGWYPQFINSGAMRSLREQGAKVIRLSMYSEANSGYLEEPYNKDFVYIGIENALAEGMYVIVDWHILKDGNPNQYKDEAMEFFREISSRYPGENQIIYEICNEPNGETSWADVMVYADTVIPIIRKYSPEAIIIVGTPQFSTDLKSPLEEPLPYDNLLYSFHKYVDVSGQKDLQFYWLEQAVERKFPVYVSEWGISYGDDSFTRQISGEELQGQMEHLDLSTAEKFLSYLNEHNIGWCGWALSNSDEIHAAINVNCTKISGWTEEDLTPGGRLMFSNFR